MTTIEKKLIEAGVKNLREFGYPDCNVENILTDQIYGAFFKSMLEENKGRGVDREIDALLARLSNSPITGATASGASQSSNRPPCSLNFRKP